MSLTLQDERSTTAAQPALAAHATSASRGPAPTTRDHLSYSAIATYQSCPLRYAFQYEMGLPEETVSANLVFGRAVHEGVQHHLRQLSAGRPRPDLGTLLDVYEAAWDCRRDAEVQFAQDESRVSLHRQAERVLVAFQSSPMSRPVGTIVGVDTELQRQIVPGLPDLLGRVDLMVDMGNTLVVTHFKSSRSRWTTDQVEAAADQLLLHGQLVRDMAQGRKLELQFCVITKTKDPSVECHAVEWSPTRSARSTRVIEHVWSAIASSHFYPAPSALNCGSCPFREACRVWDG
ncbi:MAG: PD-(D/E)XK nuclease family protein [Planctomycetota bacterium]|nr:PD-(D/E)XK nuclease family protein [Planctomycetota bacterium]